MLYFFRGVAVDASDGDGDATEGGDEAAVTGDADDVAFEARKGTGDDAHEVMPFGVVVQRMVQEADAGGLYLRGAHEGLHDAVGNDGGLPCGAVTCQVDISVAFTEEGLHRPRLGLHEEETRDGGTLLVANAPLATVVDDVGVHEGGEMLGKSLADMRGASGYVEVAPGGGGGGYFSCVHCYW